MADQKLSRYMQIEEAMAWIRYRTDSSRAAVRADKAYLRVLQRSEIHADRTEIPVDDPDATSGQLHRRLRAGEVTAVDLDARPIPHTKWEAMRPWRHEPYPTVLVREDQVLRYWPPKGALKRGRPPVYDWDKIDPVIREEIAIGGANIPLRVQTRCSGKVPSERAIRERIKSLADGNSAE